jgi:hypothetical protein
MASLAKEFEEIQKGSRAAGPIIGSQRSWIDQLKLGGRRFGLLRAGGVLLGGGKPLKVL